MAFDILHKQRGGRHAFKSHMERSLKNPEHFIPSVFNIKTLDEKGNLIIDLDSSWGHKEARGHPPLRWSFGLDLMIREKANPMKILGGFRLVGRSQFKEEISSPTDTAFQVLGMMKYFIDHQIPTGLVHIKVDEIKNLINYDFTLTRSQDSEPILMSFSETLDPLIFRIAWSDTIAKIIWKQNHEGRILKETLVSVAPVFQVKLREAGEAWNTLFGTKKSINKAYFGLKIWYRLVMDWEKERITFNRFEDFFDNWLMHVVALMQKNLRNFVPGLKK